MMREKKEAIVKKFNNKQEFIDFVEYQINVKLKNDKTDLFNKKRNVLYTRIPDTSSYMANSVLFLLDKFGIRYQKHFNGYYWIWIK